jgi:TonB family protein
MPRLAILAILPLSFLCAAGAQAQQQERSSTPAQPSQRNRISKENDVCCFTSRFVEPVYPAEARLAHIQGEVRLDLVIAPNGSVSSVRIISGQPILANPSAAALRQWHFDPIGTPNGPVEHEVTIVFTFTLQDPPKPAYLHLTNGETIRAEEVREFTNRFEYKTQGKVHTLTPAQVINVNQCGCISALLKDGCCIPGGGPSFDIRAFPLFPADSPPLK